VDDERKEDIALPPGMKATTIEVWIVKEKRGWGGWSAVEGKDALKWMIFFYSSFQYNISLLAHQTGLTTACYTVSSPLRRFPWPTQKQKKFEQN
jgi:hypothetical protein